MLLALDLTLFDVASGFIGVGAPAPAMVCDTWVEVRGKGLTQCG